MRQLANHGVKRADRIGVAAALILAIALVGAPAAMASVTKSTNWAGYAIHRSGVSFRSVSAAWTQPHATCVAGGRSFSAVWVGLGGYKPTSRALEQVGTEVDCDAHGKVLSSAWFELVPAPSRTFSLPVRPGDAMHAEVTVTGHRVVVELDNLTKHRSFRETTDAGLIDISSAEWIVEAPSECINSFSCQALPLTDFGSVTFASAAAASSTGRAGTITDGHWGRTKIKLTPGAQRLTVAQTTNDTAGTAAPSPLRSGGSVFEVTYATATIQPAQSSVRRQSRLRAAYLRH
ncbi:MAG: hypothetical protein JOZ95_00640 [Solirubrobacterales bacterium]|nr:hypothetical protein [Solirubrobacterales bacterium]